MNPRMAALPAHDLVPLEFYPRFMVAHREKIWITRYGSNNPWLVKDSVGRGWCVEGNYANIGAIVDGSLRMGSNARGLSPPGL
jgi:hypothetical protein